jgi:hypothetical protein
VHAGEAYTTGAMGSGHGRAAVQCADRFCGPAIRWGEPEWRDLAVRAHLPLTPLDHPWDGRAGPARQWHALGAVD